MVNDLDLFLLSQTKFFIVAVVVHKISNLNFFFSSSFLLFYLRNNKNKKKTRTKKKKTIIKIKQICIVSVGLGV